MESLFDRLGIAYTLAEDGMYYPEIALPKSEPPRYGKYGRTRLRYLQEHHTLMYQDLLLEGKLTAHLNEIDDSANDRMKLLTRQMQEQQGVTEELKDRDQLAWVGAMNNIHAAAEEIVYAEVVYI